MKKIINFTIALLVFLLPLFFLPLTTDFYGLNKTLLLHCSVGLLLIFWAIKIVREKQIRLVRSPLNLPILLYSGSYILSTVFASPNKVEALLGRTGLIISLTILYFIIINNLRAVRYVIYPLIASAAVLSLISIYQYIGVGQELFELPVWMQSKIWTPTGSPLALLTFLLPVFILSLVLALKAKESLSKTLLFLAAALQVIGCILTISLIWPGQEFSINLLPIRAGWQIAVSAFGISPLFGVGPENFLSAFTRFRPAYLNNLVTWTARFLVSSNEYFQIFTTVGILGLGTYLLLIWRAGQAQHRLRAVIVFIFILQLFFPANLVFLFLQFVLLAVLARNGKETTVQLASPWLILIPFAFYSLFSIFYSGRTWLADYYLRQSFLAAAENRGKDTYDLQIKAAQLNPYADRYRVAFSWTNLALANSIAGNPDISDQDRQDVSQLIQQTIREAKIATNLNGNKVTNWENLASIYRNLINFAEGADQWTIVAYIQAIRLDPTNPLLRVDLGGLHYSLENYDDAIRQFQIATELKPDYTNGYYNLAVAYREKDEIRKAVDNMTIVTNLVEIDSGDYQKAQAELEELKERLPEEERVEAIDRPETLREPEALPSPIISPPIELPEESAPEITPEPSPSPEALPSPTL